MNTAQHANRIIEAWKVADSSGMAAALDSALCSSESARADSQLEQERRQLLETVAAHLQALEHKDALPKYSQTSGAQRLLHHLRGTKRVYGFGAVEFATKN